jgi:hypothetical protein
MVNPADERIAELEAKVRELEALTRGLTDEMLDLKSIVMKLNARTEERRPVVQPRPGVVPATKKDNPAPAPVEAAQGASLEMIMQADGTLKPERRTSSDYIIASGRYGQKNAKKGKGGDTKEGAPLIYATEDDSTTDDSVVIKKKK